MPVLSLLIPAYNSARFIEATLQSASAQSENDLEIIVIDDCSSDDTAEVVRRAASADPRIRLLTTPRNGGPSVARNVGLREAKAKWVAMLDADDSMTQHRLAVLVALGDLHDADMVSDNILLIDESGRALPVPMIGPDLLQHDKQLGLAEFIERNVGHPSQPRMSYGFMKPIIRREFLNRHLIQYDEQVRFAEDFALYVACLRAGAVWWVTPEPMYRYLVRENSLTQVQTAADLDRLRTRQRQMLQDPQTRADPDLDRALRAHLTVVDRNFYYRAFTDAVKARKLGEAIRIFFASSASGVIIVRESLRQTPIILAKLGRGGYGRGVSSRL